jgi:hypothetical protein
MEVSVDSNVNQLARELADAIASAVAHDARIDACRAKALAAGYELRVSLDASVGFARMAEAGARPHTAAEHRPAVRAGHEITNGDRRFLKSLRIAADEAAEKKEVE